MRCLMAQDKALTSKWRSAYEMRRLENVLTTGSLDDPRKDVLCKRYVYTEGEEGEKRRQQADNRKRKISRWEISLVDRASSDRGLRDD